MVIVCACIPTLPRLFLDKIGKRKKPAYRLDEYPRKNLRYSDGQVIGDSIDRINDINGRDPTMLGDRAKFGHLGDGYSIARTADFYQEWHVV